MAIFHMGKCLTLKISLKHLSAALFERYSYLRHDLRVVALEWSTFLNKNKLQVFGLVFELIEVLIESIEDFVWLCLA